MRIYILMLTGALLAASAMVAAEPAKEKSYEVPYRLTLPKHLMVRAKINGKGPFNFILDTGAPALFFTEAVAARAGVKADEKGWGECERFELEGGLVIPKARGRIDTPLRQKSIWLAAVGGIGVVLLLSGGLTSLQAGAIATGLPLALVLLGMAAGTFKGLLALHREAT